MTRLTFLRFPFLLFLLTFCELADLLVSVLLEVVLMLEAHTTVWTLMDFS